MNAISLDSDSDDEPQRARGTSNRRATAEHGGSSSDGGGGDRCGASSSNPLVVDDDEEQGGREKHAPAQVVLLSDDDDGGGDGDGGDDDDVQICGESTGVEEVAAPERRLKAPRLANHDSDDLQVVGVLGDTAADFPHARCDCTTTKFSAGRARLTVAGNASTCPQCYCYVCQVPASECSQWTSRDARRPAHCNAHGKLALWIGLRGTHARAAAARR